MASDEQEKSSRAEKKSGICITARFCLVVALHSGLISLYTMTMQQLILEMPDELSAYLAGFGRDLQRAALETIAAEAYREEKLSTSQLRRLLGYKTRMQVHAFLKEHGIYLRYDLADLEHDRQAGADRGSVTRDSPRYPQSTESHGCANRRPGPSGHRFWS